jgi:DNA polymerase-3 subunit delta'
MNQAAANSFLKTLEEPNPNTTIILIAENINAMLPTILSRCQKLKFAPLANAEIDEYLLDNYENLDESERRIIASFAQGSISSAIDFIDSDIVQLADSIVDVLRAALQRSNYRSLLAERIALLSKSRDKNLVVNSLKLLQRWLQDALHIKNGEEQLIVNINTTSSIRKFATFYSKADYFEAFEYIEQAIIKVNRNVGLDLLLIDLFLKLRRVLLNSEA